MNLQKKWLAYCKPANLREIYTNMGGQYTPKSGKKMRIAKALLFWQFIRTQLRFTEEPPPGAEVRNWLNTIINDGETDVYIKIIAMMEFLPVKVLRALLWRGNIDFPAPTNSNETSLQCMEACLRRMNTDQLIALSNTYEQVQRGELPEVMKPLLWLSRLLYMIVGFIRSQQSLQEMWAFDDQQTMAGDRYLSKSAWAYNLLGIDFGFALYPKGVNDDTVIANKSFTRFLSVKNHINDFVVNQENGLYWWLYKSARSNYVMSPSKKVELKPHVCPGFWATLARHFIFWVVSPVTFVVLWFNAPINMDFNGLWHIMKSTAIITLITIGCITPIWCLIAAVKLLFHVIGELLKKMIDPSEEQKEKWKMRWLQTVNSITPYLRTIGKILRSLGIICIILVICFFIWLIGEWIQVHFDAIIAIIKKIGDGLKDVIATSYMFLKTNSLILLLTGIMLFAAYKLMVVMNLAIDLSERFEDEYKKIWRYMLLAISSSAGIIWYTAPSTFQWSFDSNILLSLLGMFGFFILIIAGIAAFETHEYKKSLRERRAIAAVISQQEFKAGKSSWKMLPYRTAMKNPFFLHQTEEMQQDILTRIKSITCWAGNQSYNVGRTILLKWTPENDVHLKSADEAGCTNYKIIMDILNGASYQDALKNETAREKARKDAEIARGMKIAKFEKMKKDIAAWIFKNRWTWFCLFTISIYVLIGIGWVIKKVFWEFPITLKNLWVMFYSEACPYITKQKHI